MMNHNLDDDTVEKLDFEDETEFEKTVNLSLDDVEMLDYDEKISKGIDEILDFDISDSKVSSDKTELSELLDNTKDENKIEIDASKEKLDEYIPSIKDFNIKSAKVRKVVKKSMLYVIILMLLGFEFFITKTGDVLNDLRVYASDNQPIKIMQNQKYGFIDYTGNKIVNPKYIYADDFIKGYAIVKNASSLPLIINKGGKEVVPTGNYFSLYRADDDIIASKATKKGLKYGILDSNLKEKTLFEYDSIYYLQNLYSYVKNNTVGLINKDGKNIFSYKLTDDDDKVIEVTKSKVTGDYTEYGVVKVNGTSQVVNLASGKEVSSPTLNTIVPEENNVFYEVMNDGLRRYFYVFEDSVVLESDNYKSLSINSISSGVLKAITNKYEYEFISVKTREQIGKKLNVQDTYEGDCFMYKERNYKKNTNSIILVKNGEKIASIDGVYDVYQGFVNGIAILKYDDGTYGYINEKGEFINNDRYILASSFDAYGDAIAKKQSGYGVIDKSGKTKIEFENNDIRMASFEVKKKTVNDSNNVFYAVKKENRFVLYNSKGNKVNNKFYNDIIFDSKYPLFKASTDALDLIITSEKMKEIKLSSFNLDYEAHDNYIMVKNEYYNYDGKLIYTHAEENGGE